MVSVALLLTTLSLLSLGGIAGALVLWHSAQRDGWRQSLPRLVAAALLAPLALFFGYGYLRALGAEGERLVQLAAIAGLGAATTVCRDHARLRLLAGFGLGALLCVLGLLASYREVATPLLGQDSREAVFATGGWPLQAFAYPRPHGSGDEDYPLAMWLRGLGNLLLCTLPCMALLPGILRRCEALTLGSLSFAGLGAWYFALWYLLVLDD